MPKFQEGDWVKQRDGKIVGPISVNHRGLLTVPQFAAQSNYHFPTGHYAFGVDHAFDFVCVVAEPKPLPAPIERITVFKEGEWHSTQKADSCVKIMKNVYNSNKGYRLFRTVTTFKEEL